MRAVRLLHRLAFLRSAAKSLCRGWVVRQPFHGGVICLDAVEHSWAWTGRNSYEKFDQPLQDALLRESQERPWLVDLGSNLGAMTLSVVLRNPRAHAVAVDPNPRAHQLLQKSVRRNRLGGRVRLVTAAVAPPGAAVRFDFTGSVVGHVTADGSAVRSATVTELLNLVPAGERPLVKLDIEGFESQVLAELIPLVRARQAVLFAELHAQGMNGWGDPARGFEQLRSSGATLTDVEGHPLEGVDPSAITHVVARWS